MKSAPSPKTISELGMDNYVSLVRGLYNTTFSMINIPGTGVGINVVIRSSSLPNYERGRRPSEFSLNMRIFSS